MVVGWLGWVVGSPSLLFFPSLHLIMYIRVQHMCTCVRACTRSVCCHAACTASYISYLGEPGFGLLEEV